MDRKTFMQKSMREIFVSIQFENKIYIVHCTVCITKLHFVAKVIYSFCCILCTGKWDLAKIDKKKNMKWIFCRVNIRFVY